MFAFVSFLHSSLNNKFYNLFIITQDYYWLEMDNKALNVHRNYVKQLKLMHTMVYTGNSFSLAFGF